MDSKKPFEESDDIIGHRIAQWDNGVLSAPLGEEYMYNSFYWPKSLKRDEYPHLLCFWRIKKIKKD